MRIGSNVTYLLSFELEWPGTTDDDEDIVLEQFVGIALIKRRNAFSGNSNTYKRI